MSKSPLELGKRERQIVEAVYRFGEASVADVLADLDNPPSYSAVRAMLGQLVDKGILKYRQDGKRYLYRPAIPKEKARKTALRHMVSTFFSGEPLDAMAALLDLSAEELSTDDLQRMKRLIKKVQSEDQE